MPNPNHISLKLVELIYDAVENPSRWSVFLKAIVDATGSSRATLAIVPAVHLKFAVGCMHGWSDEDIRVYGERYVAQDPFQIGITKLADGYVGTNLDLCSDEEMEQSRAYREFYAPRHTHHGLGCAILRTASGMSLLTVTRSKEAGPYREAELALMWPLVPHLQRAVRLHGELSALRSQVAAFDNLLDLYPHPFLLTDADATVIYANGCARKAAERKNPFSIESGRLEVRSFRGDDALRAAIRQVASSRDWRLRRLDVPRAGINPYRLLLMAVPGSKPGLLGTAHICVAILAIDLESGPRPDPAMIAELYALTPAEARFAASLVSGYSVEEISGQLGITRETARTHLRRVLSKTQTRRQGECISLLLRGIPFSRQDAAT